MLALRRFPPVGSLDLRRDFDRLFDGLFETEPLAGARPVPALNVWEDGDHLFAEAEVPGIKMEDLEVTVHGNELSIKGTRRPSAGEDKVYHRRETAVGEFARFLTLPAEVDAERIEAKLQDGLLRIVLPKADKARARKIAVKTG